MTRILLSASTFPLDRHDVRPRFVLDLAQALAEHFEVGALVPDAPGALRRDRVDRVDVRRFTYFRPRRFQVLAYGDGIPVNLRSSWLAKAQLLPYLLAQARATRALVREREYRVVNSHWMIPQGLSTALARGKRARFRHVVTLHSGDAYMLRRLPFGRCLARFIMSRTDVAFTVSSNVLEVLDDVLGRPSGALIQPVGVHVDLFRPRGDLLPMSSSFPGGYLLFVGRLDEIKGVQYLLRALPRVLRAHPGLGLVLVGYGPYRDDLLRQIDRLGLRDSVELTGKRPHAQIARYLRGSRAVVVPSITEADGRTEGMPTVVIEAMASGARLVASAVGGLRDVVRHGENGWLCRPRDPEDLADKLLTALGDPPSSTICSAARETAAGLDWTVVAERYARTFERLVSP